jgi:general secretion pathway protein C
MVALRNVANSPLVAKIEGLFERGLMLARKVPLVYWRMAVLAFVSIWVCHSLARLIWYVVPSPRMPMAPVVASAGKVSVANPSGHSVDIAAIQALDLFGNSVAPVEVAPVETQQQLERTRLDLELQGIIAANDPKLSWAIIGKSESHKLYKIGDAIDDASGVKVAEIHTLKVILNNNGNLEELWLYGEDGMNVAAAAYTPPPPVPPAGAAQASVTRDQLEQAKNIGDVVRFMVATEGGKMIGYRVRPGRKRELFDMVGLKNDDIVVSVNGIEVNEPQKVREVYQALQNATEANLQVMREGAIHSIQITMSAEG